MEILSWKFILNKSDKYARKKRRKAKILAGAWRSTFNNEVYKDNAAI